MQRWWLPLVSVLIIGTAGVFYMGIRTYKDAPPLAEFVDAEGRTVLDGDDIRAGQLVFRKYALMDYGSMFGDGAARGPDFSAEALHTIALTMQAKAGGPGVVAGSVDADAVRAKVQRDLKNMLPDAHNRVQCPDGFVRGFATVEVQLLERFNSTGPQAFNPPLYIKDNAELHSLAAFFTWSAWVCAAKRPGSDASWTHNWPYDPEAGNVPGASIMLWSVVGLLALAAALGGVLWVHGRTGGAFPWSESNHRETPVTEKILAGTDPTRLQAATHKYFAVAAILFVLQVVAGVLTVHDFLGLTNIFGVDVAALVPMTITRSWHIQLAILWISTCWMGAAIYLLPSVSRAQPKNQVALVNTIFALLVVVTAGTLIGNYMGPKGMLGDLWNLLGNQGWEMVELGRLWQWVLMGALVLWMCVVVRGAKPAMQGEPPWSMSWWLVYAVCAIPLLFSAGFVAREDTNFVIADFWRWCVIHMWAEAFFEVFTTVIVAWMMHRMGLVPRSSAVRIVYLSVLLYLGSGILGISHNFYWNAKPMATLAIGSVFSTLQVVPLILLALEAWRFRRLPQDALRSTGSADNFAHGEAFLFLLGVNFWNFLGAGVFGLIINLPIMNYYEHGTYLTVNHGHAALMGVYGNLAIAAMLWCTRGLVRADRWSPRMLRFIFWSINLGLLLMLVLDTLPLGLIQFHEVTASGLWSARSAAFVEGDTFQTLTWLRAVGGWLFFFGGVMPLAWFMATRFHFAKRAAIADEVLQANRAPQAAAHSARG